MPNFRLAPLVTATIPNTICLEGGVSHREWAHIYHGAVFPRSYEVGGRRVVIVNHGDWLITPEYMSDHEFDIASTTFRINIREIAAQVEAGFRRQAGVFVSAMAPSLPENPERIAAAEQLCRRRPGRLRYIPDNIVEPLPLP